MTRKLFGTDGVRGVAGEFLTRRARARARRAPRPRASRRRAPRRCWSSATRASPARCCEAALAAGVSAAGGDALLGGVLPTPGRAAADRAATASTSRSSSPPRTTPTATTASSSSARDGFKLSDETEAAIEQRARDRAGARRADRSGASATLHGALEDYLRELAGRASPASTSSGVRRRCSTAPTARRTTSRPRSSAASAPTST